MKGFLPPLLLAVLLLAPALAQGASSTLAAGSYARYKVLYLGGDSYMRPEAIEARFVGEGGLVISRSDVLVKEHTITCRDMVYEWRVLAINSTWAEVLVNLTFIDANETLAYRSLKTGRLVNSTVERHFRLSFTRRISVRLSDGSSYMGGRRIGWWPYWLPGKRRANTTIIIASNITLPSGLSTRFYAAVDVLGPAVGGAPAIKVDGETLKGGQVIVAKASKNYTGILRLLGIKASENITGLQASLILAKAGIHILAPLTPEAMYYDASSGILLQARYVFGKGLMEGYIDDILYKAIRVGWLLPSTPQGGGTWALQLVATNIHLGKKAGGTEHVLENILLALAITAALIAASLYILHRRRTTAS